MCTDFSLENWINNEGYDFESGSLKEYMIEKLFDTLGVSKYLDENECNRELHPFSNGLNGWTTGKLPYQYVCIFDKACNDRNMIILKS
jgi:hypothetical protein